MLNLLHVGKMFKKLLVWKEMILVFKITKYVALQ